jgi:hypothetical protein
MLSDFGSAMIGLACIILAVAFSLALLIAATRGRDGS